METSRHFKPPRETSTQNKPPKENYAYFKPSEMVFVISHAHDNVPTEQEMDYLLGDEKSGGMIDWTNREENKRNPRLRISRVKERELHFPGSSQLPEPPKLDGGLSTLGIKYVSPQPARRKAFSIVPAEVRLAEDYRDDKNPEGLVDTAEVAELVASLDNARGSLQDTLNSQRDISQMITVEVVSPNWLSSPAKTEYGGGGGPGSRPVPFTRTTTPVPYTFQLPTAVDQLCPEKDQRGKGVKVAILDTAPCLQQLVEAYELYHKVRPERHWKQRRETGDHPLIESLLRPGGPLHVHPASFDELLRMRALHLRDHDYIMTDHGLFVAGIIHTIAPAAEIHLYEVLNPQGTGDLESIARGLWKVAEEQYQVFVETGKIQPLVVNCSLMLDIPLEGDPDNPNSAKIIPSDAPLAIVGHRLTDMDSAILDKIRNDSDKNDYDKWVVRSGSVIMWICDLLFFLGSRVIAAAGNDWDPSDPGRPQARFPAAFQSVQGVGALKKEQNQAAITQNANYDVASYSDLSDQPGKVGVATLGGEPGEDRGVLGIYLGEFPEPLPGEWSIILRLLNWLVNLFGGKFLYPKNESHWAWWAGTSFATPILSGVLAAVLSRPAPPPTTEGAIVELYQARAIEEARTEYQEDLLSVTQG